MDRLLRGIPVLGRTCSTYEKSKPYLMKPYYMNGRSLDERKEGYLSIYSGEMRWFYYISPYMSETSGYCKRKMTVMMMGETKRTYLSLIMYVIVFSTASLLRTNENLSSPIPVPFFSVELYMYIDSGTRRRGGSTLVMKKRRKVSTNFQLGI